jgi:hypothetical protein
VLDATKPLANGGQSQTVDVGARVTFDASGCTDNFGIISYNWDFGNGTTGTGKTPTHTYSNEGIYTATLTVQDAAGNTATNTVRITIQTIVIPEFPFPNLPLLFLLSITLITAIIYKRKTES